MFATAGGPSRRPRRIIRVPTTTTKKKKQGGGGYGVGVLGAVWTVNPAAGLVDEAAEFKPRRAGKKKTEAG